VAVHFSVFELTVVARLIWPNHYTVSMHIIVAEISLINFTRISKIIFSFSVEFSIYKIAIIIASIKFKSSSSSFFTFRKLSCIPYLSFVPSFSSHAMLLIIFPLPLIHRAFYINKYSMSICFSILPVTLVNITIGMCHSTLSIKNFIFSDSLVNRSILEFDFS